MRNTVKNTVKPEHIDAIAKALEAGRKIEAIKIYRAETGEDLKAAKDFIDALIPKLQEKDPARYAKLTAGRSGCACLLLGGFVLIVAVTMITRLGS